MDAIPEFGTPRENEERRDGGCAIIFDPETALFAVYELVVEGDTRLMLFSGGVEEGEDTTEGILREVREESGLHDFAQCETVGEAITHYRNVVKQVNRIAHATCLLLVLRSRDVVPTEREAHESFILTWHPVDEITASWDRINADHGRDHWHYFMERALLRLRELGYAL